MMLQLIFKLPQDRRLTSAERATLGRGLVRMLEEIEELKEAERRAAKWLH